MEKICSAGENLERVVEPSEEGSGCELVHSSRNVALLDDGSIRAEMCRR